MIVNISFSFEMSKSNPYDDRAHSSRTRKTGNKKTVDVSEPTDTVGNAKDVPVLNESDSDSSEEIAEHKCAQRSRTNQRSHRDDSVKHSASEDETRGELLVPASDITDGPEGSASCPVEPSELASELTIVPKSSEVLNTIPQSTDLVSQPIVETLDSIHSLRSDQKVNRFLDTMPSPPESVVGSHCSRQSPCSQVGHLVSQPIKIEIPSTPPSIQAKNGCTRIVRSRSIRFVTFASFTILLITTTFLGGELNIFFLL